MKTFITIFFLLFVSISFSQEKNLIGAFTNPIETSPIYQSCEKEKSISKIKNCTTTKIDSIIKNNFNYSVTKHIKLEAGEHIVYIVFKIDTEGKVIYKETKKTDYQPLIDEAIRVVNLIPKFVAPATQRGKSVSVNYIFPITFVVE